MKIVFLTYMHGFGGAEKQNAMLANAMVAKGHDVTVISISLNNVCYALDEHIKYIFLPDRTENVLRIVTRYQDIKSILKKIKPDITVNFWFQSAYMSAFMSKKYVGKLIYAERGDPGDSEYNGLLSFIRKITLPRIDGFVFQSRGAQEFFNEKIKKRSIVVPNPVFISNDKLPEIDERRKVIVSVGRLHHHKNYKLLIDAFALIADRIPDYSLEIYGDGELKENLIRQINENGLTKRVFIKGTSDHIHQLIYDASLFVLSSDHEGMPNTLMEAMALGIPCISTDCKPGGAREIIDNDINGCITPSGDKKALADAIINVLSDRELCNRFGIEGKKKMKQFKPEYIYERWESFFVKLVDD